ncbi:hypothetical protein [Candidatus Pyrohabitans sp.]
MAKILLVSEGVSEQTSIERYTMGLACSLRYDIKLLFIVDERYAVELIGGGLYKREVDALRKAVEEKAREEFDVFKRLSLNIEYRVEKGVAADVLLKELEKDREVKLVIIGYSPTGWLKEIVEKPLLPEILKRRRIPVLVVPESIREEDFFSVLKC